MKLMAGPKDQKMPKMHKISMVRLIEFIHHTNLPTEASGCRHRELILASFEREFILPHTHIFIYNFY